MVHTVNGIEAGTHAHTLESFSFARCRASKQIPRNFGNLNASEAFCSMHDDSTGGKVRDR